MVASGRGEGGHKVRPYYIRGDRRLAFNFSYFFKIIPRRENMATTRDESKKRRKKEAKREAKLMVKIERAKEDVRKAEKKSAKAQAHFEACASSLRDLSAKMAQMREQNSSPHEAAHETAQQPDVQEKEQDADTHTSRASTVNAIAAGDQYDISPVPSNQLQPAEGRNDVSQEQTGDDTRDAGDAKVEDDEIQVEKGQGGQE